MVEYKILRQKWFMSYNYIYPNSKDRDDETLIDYKFQILTYVTNSKKKKLT